MAKKAKKVQTDYTKGGRDISNTAIPLYQTNLQQISDYNADPSARTDSYLDKYYTNTSAQNDFLREYNRAMANKTSQNYSATGGGYSSAGQRAYDDLQRYQDDLASRLYDQGVANASAMAQRDFSNLLQANNAYNQAYALGKEYSDIEQYNNMVSQNNKWYNQVAQALPAIGSGIGSVVGGPVGSTLGGTLGGALAGTFSTDTSDYFGTQGAGSSRAQGVGTQGGQYVNQWTPVANAIGVLAAQKETSNQQKANDDFLTFLRGKQNQYGGGING